MRRPWPSAGPAGRCFKPGMAKSTYGTGCFALLNTGDTPVTSRARLLTTVAVPARRQAHHALEGAIFIAGAAVQWLHNGLKKLISTAAETGTLAAAADPGRCSLHGAGLRRARCAMVGRGGARRAVRLEPQVRPAARRARWLPTRELLDAMRAWPRGRRHGAARRRRHDGERLPRCSSSPTCGVPVDQPAFHGNDRTRRGKFGGPQGQASVPISRVSPFWAARPPLRAENGRRRPASANGAAGRGARRRRAARHIRLRIRRVTGRPNSRICQLSALRCSHANLLYWRRIKRVLGKPGDRQQGRRR